MAVYLRNASAGSAVTAFLSQFKIAADGDITYVAGADTFHVWWLHRALQKLAWDFAISGDDEINLTKPNPSTSEAIGTIITLKDWAADYAISYNITDEVATYLFGGSVEQGASGAVTRYSGLIVLGSVNTSTNLQVIQNGALLTSHWGSGKNQIDSSTLLSILIKTHDTGVEIDNSIVNVKANTWGDSFAIWQTTLGLGEKVAAINTASDPQNDTLQATVKAYSIVKSEGYKLIDVDGAGDKPFVGEWSYGSYNKKALHEFVKSILVYNTAETIHGIDGDLWTGRLFDCVITPGAGGDLWVQNETITWPGGEGQLVAVDNVADDTATRIVIHLNKGIAPANADVLSGTAASQIVSSTPDSITTNPNLLGVFTGTAWIGATGIGFAPGELGNVDSVTDLNGNVLSPPNNVNIQVTVETGLAGDDPHVFLAKKHATNNAPDYAVYTGTNQTAGAGTLIINEAISSDTPQSGQVLVKTTGQSTAEFYDYTSWAGSTFALSGTLNNNITNGDDVFPAILYTSATGGGTSKLASNSLIYSSDIDVTGWVRHGDPATPDKPVPISGTIGTAGLSLTVVLDDES